LDDSVHLDDLGIVIPVQEIYLRVLPGSND
jgi:hypothetical protein